MSPRSSKSGDLRMCPCNVFCIAFGCKEGLLEVGGGDVSPGLEPLRQSHPLGNRLGTSSTADDTIIWRSALSDQGRSSPSKTLWESKQQLDVPKASSVPFSGLVVNYSYFVDHIKCFNVASTGWWWDIKAAQQTANLPH